MLALGAGLAATVAFIALGNWQLDRAAFKAEIQARRTAAGTAAVALPAAADFARIDTLHVHAEGRWLADRTVWIDNRTHDGRAGVHLVTPLRLDDGSLLYVNRGWAPLVDRARLPQAPLSRGPVSVEGFVVHPDTHGFTLAGGDARPELWTRIDPARLVRHAGTAAVYPVVLELQSELKDGLVRDWAPPAQGPQRHRAYALQWFAFAAMAAVLTLYWGWRSGRREQA